MKSRKFQLEAIESIQICMATAKNSEFRCLNTFDT